MGSMAARQHFQHHVPSPSDQPQQRCARGLWCSAKTRDAETGEWHPALAAQPLCPADQDVMVTYLDEIPGCWHRLAALSLDPVRAGRAIRRPPGSRVLVNAEADALQREMTWLLAAWAARVRGVPQLRLSVPPSPPGSPERLAADCATLAAHPGPLMALPAAPMYRTWTWAPTGDDSLPAWVDADTGGLDWVRGGDGWGTWIAEVGGDVAALDVISLRTRAVRMLGETPAPRELLDGIPCRKCEAMSSLEVLPLPVPDPERDAEGKHPPFCRCEIPSCHDVMTRPEYDQWVAQYRAWAEGAGVQSCRRCARGDCADCAWRSCACTAAEHPRRRVA